MKLNSGDLLYGKVVGVLIIFLGFEIQIFGILKGRSILFAI